MSKFNETIATNAKTTNLAGGTAFSLGTKDKLMSQVLTSFFKEPKYYGDNSNEIVQTIRDVVKKDPKFIANLAIYARNVLHMRSITHVLVTELAHDTRGKKYVRQVVSKVVERPDDMTEIMSNYLATYGKPIPNSLKKGLGDAFKTFDEYSLAKYNRTNKAVKLKDIYLLCRPSPKNDDQYNLWRKLINDTLEVPVTWETQISTRGNKKEVWEDLIEGNKLGYMASLRNLRNILNVDASNFNKLLDKLGNPEAIRKSKQLPFRFLSAYREIESNNNGTKVRKTLNTLEDAISISVENMLRLSGTTFLTNDNSGSMESKLSDKGNVSYNDVGAMLMSIASKFCDNAITSVFGEDFKVVNVSDRDGIISNMKKFANTNVGHSTYMYKSIEYLLSNKIHVDRIIVFSDMQAYGDYSYGWNRANISVQKLLDEYKKQVNPNVWVHSIDLTGHGTAQMKGNKVNLVSGWSDKVLDYIGLVEAGSDNMTDMIDNYFFKN